MEMEIASKKLDPETVSLSWGKSDLFLKSELDVHYSGSNEPDAVSFIGI
jgi:hypothetical protein